MRSSSRSTSRSALGARLLLACATLGVAPGARACPCRGTSSAATRLTSAGERVGGTVTERFDDVTGAWDRHGTWSRTAEGETLRAWSLEAALGWRAAATTEVALRSGVTTSSVGTPTFQSSSRSPTDTFFTLRHEPSTVTALALGVRAPTGAVGRSSIATGAVGSAASAQGLGAWELELAGEATLVLSDDLTLGLALALAARAPDTSLGLERRLGPRAASEASLRWAAVDDAVLGLTLGFAGETEVTLDGEPRPGTARRSLTTGALASYVPRGGPWRTGVAFTFTPPVSDLGMNALSATTLALSVGYSR